MSIFQTYEIYEKPVVLFRAAGRSSPDLSGRMIDFRYEDHLRKVDKIDLHFSDPEHELPGDPRFDADVEWEIRYGYPKDMSRIIKMRLKYYTPVYEQDNIHSIRVVLMGKGQDLVRVKSPRNWGRLETSEIAKQIASRYGLTANVSPSGDQVDTAYVQGADVSDFEYLSQLSADIDFEFYVEGNSLVYRSRDEAYSESPRSRFVYGGSGSLMTSFRPTIKATKASNVVGRGVGKDGKAAQPKIDHQNVGGIHLGPDLIPANNRGDAASRPKSGAEAKQRIQALKKQYDIDNTLRQQTQVQIDLQTGALSEKFLPALPDSASASVATPESNPTKVTKLVKAKKRHFLEQSVEAVATFIGSPIMRAKGVYVFVVPDRRLSGAWYCKQATHTINSSGYSVTMDLHKGAFSDKKARNPNNRTNGDGKPVVNAPTFNTIHVIDTETGRSSTIILPGRPTP